MKTFNHAYVIAFSVGGSSHERGYDVTPAQLKRALLKRIKEIDKLDSWDEAVGAPFDTYEEDVPCDSKSS